MRLGLGTWAGLALLALAYCAWAACAAAEGFYQPIVVGAVVVGWLVWEAWREN